MGEEDLPLINTQDIPTRRLQRSTLIINVIFLVAFTVVCWPSIVSSWHHKSYPDIEVEARSWTWAGINALWLAIAVGYTVFHQFEDKILVAAASVLCAVFWGYMIVLMFIQLLTGKMALIPFLIEGAISLIPLVLGAVSAGRGDGAVSESMDVKKGWREIVLFVIAVQFLLAFLTCWPIGLVLLTPTHGHHENIGWQLNSAGLAALTLAVLWATFRKDSYAEETKKAACYWCAIICGFDFLFIVFKWHTLGLTGHNFITEIILLIDVGFLVFAARRE